MATDQEDTSSQLSFADIERALNAGEVDAPALLKRFLGQPDAVVKDPPAGTITTDELQRRLNVARRKRRKSERIKASTEVWRTFLTQPAPLPERFKVADVVVALYQRAEPSSQALVLRLVEEVPWDYGFFGAIKRIAKLAEDSHDVLTWATIHAMARGARGTVSGATRTYLSKRAWRFLRDLGRALPELFPWWSAEFLLRSRSWSPTSNKIMDSLGKGRGMAKALTESWAKSPGPLLLIVQGARDTSPVKAAWAALKKLHPDATKAPDPSWLKSLLADGNEQRHEVFVDVTKLAPSVTPAALVTMGLADACTRLLVSSSKDARAWAMAFVRGRKDAVKPSTLVELAGESKEAQTIAAEVLTALPPRDLGSALLVKLLAVSSLKSFAEKALLEQFTLAELGEQLLADLAYDDDDGGTELFQKLDKKHSLTAAQWRRVLDDDRLEDAYGFADTAVTALKKLRPEDIGADWLLDLLVRRKSVMASELGDWLEESKGFPGLDIERVKGFLFDSDLQESALKILGNRHLVKPTALGIPWLLSLAKRKDTSLQEFANRTLLEHMAPADFADGNAERGVARLFELALSPSEAPALRAFAQTYLRCHHPDLGEQQPEAKLIGLKPQLKRTAYTSERLWPALRDVRDDVRRFAVTIARSELRRWGTLDRIGDIADTDAVDVRRLALDAMLKAGDPAADPACTCTLDELRPETIFPLTESRRRAVREAGMELIRRHYSRLGGQERLAWLMTSADREVRLFAVRILWEKHRPRSFPQSWKPRVSALDAAVHSGEVGAFDDVGALRAFLRRVLFALPPGRSMEAKEGETIRRISSSLAKRRVVEIVRDLAVEDVTFATAVRPLLEEMTGSLARGEWQSCLQALCAIDAVHGRPTLTSPASAVAAE